MPTAATSPNDGADDANGDRGGNVWHRPSRPVLLIVAVFAGSRLLAIILGLRFDDRLLHGAYQLLDVRLLRDDPVTSIVYLRSQPPLFNVLAALVVRLPHAAVNTTLMVLWHLMGVTAALLLFATAVRLGVRAWLATAIVCFFVLMPETMLVESWFFYSEPEMLLVALLFWGLARYASDRQRRDGWVFTASLAALVLLRSSWQALLVLVLVAMVWRMLRLGVAELAAIAAVPIVLVAAWSVKNVVVFGSWSTTSWLGMNLSYVAHAGVGDHECRRLEAEGHVSPIACERAFGKPAEYAAYFHHLPHYGVRAADDWYKSTGQPNYNATLYAAVSSRYQHDAITLLRRGGLAAITHAEAAAYTVWAEPGDDLLQLRAIRAPIARYADWFDRVLLLRPVASGWNDPARFTASAGGFPVGEALGSVSYTILAMVVLAVGGGVAGWRRGALPVRCVCAVGVIVLVYSVVVGNALDYRENNRFRVEASPVVVVLGAVAAERIVRRAAGRRYRRTRPDPTSGRTSPTASGAPG